MKPTTQPRLMIFLPVLLALVLSIAGCALPVAVGRPTPAPSAGPNLAIPTATPAPTQAAPSLAAPTGTPTMAPTRTRPAPTQAAANTQPPPAATATRKPQAAIPTSRGLDEVTIYFVAVGDNGQSGPKVGCGDSLVAVKQPIERTTGVIRAALNQLFSYKQQHIGESGLYNALWQSDLTLAGARVDNGVATVMLTGRPQMGGECDTPRFIGQIEQTILAQQGVKAAKVFLNGQPIDQALSLR